MKRRTLGLLLVTWCCALTLCYAQDGMMGTWKLNEAKSKIPNGAQKNTKVVYEAAGDNIKVTVDGVDAKGNPTHNEWVGKFDGKEYPATGDANYDSRSYKKVNARTMAMTLKKGGTDVGSGKIVVSADGKSRTVSTTLKTTGGKKVSVTAVYDKE
jgi:hypothetical protein